MPTAFLPRRGVSLPRLSVHTNFDRDSAKEVHEQAAVARPSPSQPDPPHGKVTGYWPLVSHRGPPEHFVTACYENLPPPLGEGSGGFPTT